MSKIFSKSFINNTSNLGWTPIAKIRDISNTQVNLHVLRIYSYRAEKGQPFQNDLIIRQNYSTLDFKIDNRLDSNNIYAKINIVKEENGDRTIYVKCSPNSHIYTKLEFTTAESFISPINFGVPNIPDKLFDSLVLEEIKKLDTKERNTNQCYILPTDKNPATYKFMSIKFNSINYDGITFALKVQDKEFNSDYSILSADVYCKIWCRIDDKTGNPFRATCEMLNSTKSAYDNINFSIVIDKINLCADLYVTVSRPWLSLIITLIHWNYNTLYLNGYTLYDRPSTEELPSKTDNIILTDCKKYSVGNRFIINKNPETTEKNDIIGMINEVNSNLNNFIDNLTTEQLTKLKAKLNALT